MSTLTVIVITLVAIVFSALFSGCEIAFVQSNKVRMEIDASRGGLTDRIIKRFSEHEDMFISTLLVGNNVVLVIYGITFSMLVNPLLARWLDNEAWVLVANTLLSTGLILVLGEFMPKTAFRINPNFMMRLFALPLYIIYLLLYPLAWVISGISRGLMRLLGIDLPIVSAMRLTMDQLDEYIGQIMHDTPSRQSVENEVKIFRNAIDFKDTQIGECMIPRNEIVAVSIDHTTRPQLVQKFIATGRSKIVVYREDIDDVVGYIHLSELFDTSADWTQRLKPVIFTPETMLANKMMRRMMAEKKSMAIVIDEFGGTAGLVTLEDLVEEIFGEIEDEHDRRRVDGRQIGDSVYEFAGRAEIETINEQFGLDLKESDEYHTLAGYILAYTEALPLQGESVSIDGLEFTMVKMSSTRIETVRVRKLDE